MGKDSKITYDSLLAAGFIDVNKELPSVGELVEVAYSVGSIGRKFVIEKGKVDKRGRFSGEMDWNYAIFWKPACS